MTNAFLSTNKLAKFLRYSEAFVINPFVIARGCNHLSVFINRCLYHNCTEVYVGLGGNGKKKKKKKSWGPCLRSRPAEKARQCVSFYLFPLLKFSAPNNIIIPGLNQKYVYVDLGFPACWGPNGKEIFFIVPCGLPEVFLIFRPTCIPPFWYGIICL